MTRFYLITGFLGAGKTTFLREFIQLFRAGSCAILVNEFGREDVDGQLLREISATLAEVHSGSVFCACRAEQFAAALSVLLETKPDVLLAETSGLSDPTQIQAILSAHPLAEEIDYQGCICLADAVGFEKVYATAVACQKQLAVSDVVVLNKCDRISDPARVCAMLEQYRPDIPVLQTSRGRIPSSWAPMLVHLRRREATPGRHIQDVSIQSYVVRLPPDMTLAQLTVFLQTVAGVTHRIKGFVRLEGKEYLVSCVGEDITIQPHNAPETTGPLVVLAGQGQPAGKALEAARTLPGCGKLIIEG